MKRKKPPPDEELRCPNSDEPKHQEKLKPSSPWGDSHKDSSKSHKTTQESLVIHNQKNLQEQLNLFRLQNPNLNSFEQLIPGSILGGTTVAPFWSEYTQVISNALTPLVPGEWSDLENQVLRGYASKQDANSWFSMTVTPLKKGNSLKISCPSSLGCLLGYTGTEPKISPKKPFKKTRRNSTTKTTPNAVKKIRIYPGKELHQLWKQWLAAYRWIYNWTIAYLIRDPNLSAFSLQKLARQSTRPDWVLQLPGHQLQEAVADAVDAYKQARANQGNASFKSCRAFSQVIKFKAGNFKNGTWYCQKTKGLAFKSAEQFPQQCLYGTQLLYQKGKWFGCFL